MQRYVEIAGQARNDKALARDDKALACNDKALARNDKVQASDVDKLAFNNKQRHAELDSASP